MSVPAWPIPIHQTKLTMAKPHAAGIRMPQIPTPLIINRVTTMFNSIRRAKADEGAENPAGRHRARQDDRADLIGNAFKCLAWRQKRFGLSDCSYFLRTFRIHAVSPALVTDACCLSL